MSVSNLTVKQTFTGNGSTTDFAISPIAFELAAEIRVILRDEAVSTAITETVQTLGVDYTFDDPTTPTLVQMTVAPASTEKLIIKRQSILDQTLDFVNTAGLDVEDNEDGLDHAMLTVQENDEKISRAPLLVETSPTTGLVWPEPSGDKIVGYNTAATQLKLFSATDIATLASTGDLAKNTAVIVNNQAGAADVTGWTLAATLSLSAMYMVEIFRNATTNLIANGIVVLQRPESTWRLDELIYTTNDIAGGFPAGVNLSVTETGGVAQIQYTSTNETGGLNGTIIFKRIDFPL